MDWPGGSLTPTCEPQLDKLLFNTQWDESNLALMGQYTQAYLLYGCAKNEACVQAMTNASGWAWWYDDTINQGIYDYTALGTVKTLEGIMWWDNNVNKYIHQSIQAWRDITDMFEAKRGLNDPEYYAKVLLSFNDIIAGSTDLTNIFIPDALKASVGYSYVGPRWLIEEEWTTLGGSLDLVWNRDDFEMFITTPELDSLTADVMRRDSGGILPFTIPSAEINGNGGIVWSGDNFAQGLRKEMQGPGVDVNPSLVVGDLTLSFNTDPETGYLPMNVYNYHPNKPPQVIAICAGVSVGIPDNITDFTIIPTETEAISDQIDVNLDRLRQGLGK